MKLTNTLLLMLTSAATGALITHNLSNEQTVDPSPIPTSTTVYEESNVEQDLSPSAECIAQTVKPNPSPNTGTEKAVSQEMASSKDNTATPSFEEIRYQTAQIERFRERMAAHKNKDPLKSVKDHYKSEPVDYHWASRKEETLLGLFDQDRELRRYSPLALSCKSETCEITMAASSKRESRAIYDAFLKASINNETESGQTSVSYFNDPDRGELVMYVSDGGVDALFDN